MGSRKEDGARIEQANTSLRKLGKSTSVTTDGQEALIFNNSPTELPSSESVDSMQQSTLSLSTIIKINQSVDDSELFAHFDNGIQVDSEEEEEEIVDEEESEIAACIEATSAQSVGAGPVVLTFATEIYDGEEIANLDDNNTRLTVQSAGKYEVKGSCEFDTNTTGDRAIVLVHRDVDNVAVQQAVFSMKPSAFNNGIFGAWTFDASIGDYFTIEVYQSSGTNRDVTRRQLSARLVSL